MQEYIVLENTNVYTPNLKHKNFNTTNVILKKGEVVKGKEVAIKGKRKGEDWTYFFVEIEPRKYVKLKSLNKMKEVKIGADASKEATVVKVPSNTTPLKWHYLLAIGGGILGYTYAKRKGKSQNQALMFGVGGALAGYVAGNAIYRKKMVTISK